MSLPVLNLGTSHEPQTPASSPTPCSSSMSRQTSSTEVQGLALALCSRTGLGASAQVSTVPWAMAFFGLSVISPFFPLSASHSLSFSLGGLSPTGIFVLVLFFSAFCFFNFFSICSSKILPSWDIWSEDEVNPQCLLGRRPNKGATGLEPVPVPGAVT